MSPSTINTLVTVVFIVLGITFTRSILIMLGGKNIFKKAHKGEKTAYYPIINLFTMLEIVDMSIFWGILFFVPGVNLIVLMIMSYKLGTVFNTSFGFKMGLVFLPICFYPLLFISDKQYKISDEEYSVFVKRGTSEARVSIKSNGKNVYKLILDKKYVENYKIEVKAFAK